MRILTAFWRIMRMAEYEAGADMILVDSGSNLGVVNRSILPAADYIAFPLGNDVFSLEGLSSLGAVLAVLDESPVEDMTPENDPYRLVTVKHYRTLIPMAREHRKPIFNLTPADGAVGSHAGAVRDAERDFRKLAGEIAARMGIQV